MYRSAVPSQYNDSSVNFAVYVSQLCAHARMVILAMLNELLNSIPFQRMPLDVRWGAGEPLWTEPMTSKKNDVRLM